MGTREARAARAGDEYAGNARSPKRKQGGRTNAYAYERARRCEDVREVKGAGAGAGLRGPAR